MSFSVGADVFFAGAVTAGGVTVATVAVAVAVAVAAAAVAVAARRARHCCNDGLSHCQTRNASPSAKPLGRHE
jgi:hypothetical protein